MPTKSSVIPINGGLDLVTDKLSVSPGTAKFCMNYEVGTVRGIRSVEGFSRWDGRSTFNAYTVAIYVTSEVDAQATSWTVGDIVSVVHDGGTDSAIVAQVTNEVDDANGGGPGIPTYRHYATVVFTSSPTNFAGPETIGTVSCANPSVIAPDANIDPTYVGAAGLESIYSALVTKLPSDANTRIPGLHFFRDKLYAVVDLVAIEVTRVATATTLLEGASLSKTAGGSSIGTVARVYASTNSGKDIVEIFDFVTGTSLSAGDDLYVGSTKVADFEAVAEPQKAAMYCASWDSSGGWTRVDLGRRVQYREGSTSDAEAFFLPYVRRGFQEEFDPDEVLDTGFIGADGWTEIGGGVGGWGGNQSDLESDDGAEVGSATNAALHDTAILKATWSTSQISIPAGAVVRGVELQIRRRASTLNGVSDIRVQIGSSSGTGSENKARTGVGISNVETAQTYGAPNDLWGLQLTPTQINDGGLNAQLQFRQNPSQNIYIDQVAIKVYYQEQTRNAYVYDSTATPTDQEIEVIHYTVTNGTADGGGSATGNREGLLVLNPSKTVADSAKSWQWRPGLEIRTQTGGSGVKLAELASDDDPILLPSSYALASESARYTFSTASPYGADDADVFFICSGVDHAHMFDGTYALPISTGLMWQNEKPRHAAWSGNYLALGYKSGSLAISDLGNPLVFVDAVSTAAEIGASDRVTGLLNLKGDSLGVFTENTVFALQGTDPSNFRRVTISPSSGAIEYTVCDMGQPMYCDFRGIATIATTDQYGDFNRGRLSWQATPWLLERLQSSRRNQTIDKTVVAAIPIRNKNQYRVFFADGWFATLTLQGVAGDEVAITTSRYYGDWQDRDTSAIKVLGLCAGVTSTGQDLAFMTFARDAESSRFNYVFQIDSGRSFDGEEIIAQWMSQPLQFGSPFTEKHLEFMGVIGRSYGYMPFKVYLGTQFTDPVSDETTGTSSTGYDMSFGVSTDSATATETDQKTTKNIRGNGEDFTFLIESIASDKLPHTIQAVTFRYSFEKEHA